MYERELEHLAEEARNRSLVLFVGSGVSKDAGLLDWEGLLKAIGANLGAGGGTVDYLDAAQYLADKVGKPELDRRVVAALTKDGKPPGELHGILARIPAPVVFTTNYDQLMETAIEVAQRVPPDVIVESPDIALVDEARRTTVVKMHGCLSIPRTIVLARDDYDAYAETHHAMIAYLQSLLATRTFLFVGVSLTDPNFRHIYQQIRRALRDRPRGAYLVDGKTWPEEVVTFWKKRGMNIVQFSGFEAQKVYLGNLAERCGQTTAAKGAQRILRNLEPPLKVQPFVKYLDGLEKHLSEMIEEARKAGYVPDAGEDRAGFLPAGSASAEETATWATEKAEALVGLALAVDQLKPMPDPRLWISLGDMLYDRGDARGAIRAYNAALLPREKSDRLDPETFLRVRGNLARAFAHQDRHDRAEWLLRRCVFLPGQENAEGFVDAGSVFSRLNLEHLQIRPTDASELAYNLTRRAEPLQKDGHHEEALVVLREARYALMPLLDTGDPRYRRTFFDDEMATLAWQRVRRHRFARDERGAPSYNPKAFALSFLGKCYRLACEIRRVHGADEWLSHLASAEKYLKGASQVDPLLPYPYAHRLRLASYPHLGKAYQDRLLKDVRSDLAELVHTPEGDRLLERLHKEFPKL